MLSPCRVVFMVSAMIASTLTHTLDSLGVSSKAATLAWPTNEVAQTGALLLVAALGSFTALMQAAQPVSAPCASAKQHVEKCYEELLLLVSVW